MKNQPPSIDRLREVYEYNEKTGVLVYRASRSWNTRAGMPAGCINSKGYIYVTIDGKSMLAHRIAWAIFYGRYPSGFIDHVNTNKTDNRIENLRDVTAAMNRQNQRSAMRNSGTGYLGVRRSGNKFMANIKTNNKSAYLGTFTNAEDAHAAYVRAKREAHPGNTI